ncbi:MAG: ADP-ribosylglycohydrolase family protein [Desulfuromonadales bacterium]|nr:ADP-ribosylglycohydrolase family protein [Desulfuromonadales bacterium]
MVTQDQFVGCLLGLSLGDAIGAPFEGGVIERFVWKLIGKTRSGKMRWTDDTQMSLALAKSLIANNGLDPNHLAQQFAASYRWSRGYGPAAAKLLKKIKNGKDWQQVNRSTYPEGSFGNGGAMRAPIIGMFYHQNPQQLLKVAHASAHITHAHPLGIEGALLLASATAIALESQGSLEIINGAAVNCKQKPFTTRLKIAQEWLQNKKYPAADEVTKNLGNGIAAEASCVTALYISLRFLDDTFENMMKFIIECGGDTDTIGAMAGAIWGAKRGAGDLPLQYLEKLESVDHLNEVALSLYDVSQKSC